MFKSFSLANHGRFPSAEEEACRYFWKTIDTNRCLNEKKKCHNKRERRTNVLAQSLGHKILILDIVIYHNTKRNTKPDKQTFVGWKQQHQSHQNKTKKKRKSCVIHLLLLLLLLRLLLPATTAMMMIMMTVPSPRRNVLSRLLTDMLPNVHVTNI